jgi:hypothetical protein
LDSQIYEMFLANCSALNSHFMTIADRAEKAGVFSHDYVRAHVCVGDRFLSRGDGRRNKAIKMSAQA